MALTMISTGAVYTPVLLCDQCGRPIEPGAGLALWKHGLVRVYFVHRRCDNAFTARSFNGSNEPKNDLGQRSPSDWLSEELPAFLDYLNTITQGNRYA